MKVRSIDAESTSVSEVIARNASYSDRSKIDRLPDDILRNIFSFVGCRCSVILSLVCKRWKYLLDQDLTWSILLSVSGNNSSDLLVVIEKAKNYSKQWNSLYSHLKYHSLVAKDLKVEVDVPLSLTNGLFVDDDKFYFQDPLRGSRIQIVDSINNVVKELSQYRGGYFTVHEGILYHVNSNDRRLCAYNCRTGQEIWQDLLALKFLKGIFINQKRNNICVVGALFALDHEPAIVEESISFCIYDRNFGQLISICIKDKDLLQFWTVCGDYAYFIQDKGDSTHLLYFVVNLYVPHSIPKLLFEGLKSQRKSTALLGAIEKDMHILYSKHKLMIVKLCEQQAELVFTYMPPKHVIHVFRPTEMPVFALFDDILCMHMYNTLENQYLLQFWNMSSQIIVREFKVPFKLEHIYYSGKKWIAISCDGKLFSLEFTTAAIDELRESFKSCSIM